MATLETVARNAACNAVVDLLDGGTIEFQTDTNVEVATLSLGTPAFGDAVEGVATANSISSDADATGGTVTKAVFKDSVGGAVFETTVSEEGGGGSITMSSTSVGAGDTVSMSSYTHTQPA